ncbi:MAG TPA: MarR family transcriptional regulator [Solirubrobacteraceae bacterium]|jgi:DNA-binding MarR family transcriptional regulator
MGLSSGFTQPDVAPAPPPPPLIGALLRVPYETVRARMLAGLHDRGFTDLVAAHVDVWRYPGPENQRPSELATQTRMTKQALNYLLGQLEQLGYLTRETDNNDQRSKRIRLTPRGQAATEAIYESIQDLETQWEQQLGPRRFGQLRRLLTQLNTITTPTNDQA